MTPHTLDDYARYEMVLQDFGGHIQRYCIRHAHSADEARELMQEVMASVWNSIGGLQAETPRQVNSWLKRVMRSAVSDWFRRRRMDTVPIDEAAHVAVDSGGDNELVEELLACLDEDEQRLMRRRMEGYTVKELAVERGVKPNAMAQRFFRMMEKMKQYARDEYDAKG